MAPRQHSLLLFYCFQTMKWTDNYSHPPAHSTDLSALNEAHTDKEAHLTERRVRGIGLLESISTNRAFLTDRKEVYSQPNSQLPLSIHTLEASKLERQRWPRLEQEEEEKEETQKEEQKAQNSEEINKKSIHK